jgi:glycyl-tRNA synthetase
MTNEIEQMAVFCKKKGFVYQDSEIYGSLAGFWDFGPLGVELKNNIKSSWRRRFVQCREDVVEIDGSIITHRRIWEASGHVDSFTDVLVSCTKCSSRFKGDNVVEEQLGIVAETLTKEQLMSKIKKEKLKCPKCKGLLGEPVLFNCMFETTVGPLKDKSNISFLRPETAQIIFADFKLVHENSRLKLPFGIGQVGKAFRNEISPRDFLFRCREFEQMEIEYFVHPEKLNDCPYISKYLDFRFKILTAENQKKGKKDHIEMTIKQMIDKKLTNQWHAYWLAEFLDWFMSMGINPENLRLREHTKQELAHYAGACFDIEYKFPFGWKEIHGNADRTNFDLSQHIKVSKKDLSLYDEEKKERIVPFVASEPSQGVERAFLALLFDAYNDDKERGNIVLKLKPELAPVKVGVFPLVKNKPEIIKVAREIFEDLIKEVICLYDSNGSIGRRYARADEMGVCGTITIDFDSLKDNSVTLRSRDTTQQIRVKIPELRTTINKFLYGEKLEKLGNIIK